MTTTHSIYDSNPYDEKCSYARFSHSLCIIKTKMPTNLMMSISRPWVGTSVTTDRFRTMRHQPQISTKVDPHAPFHCHISKRIHEWWQNICEGLCTIKSALLGTVLASISQLWAAHPSLMTEFEQWGTNRKFQEKHISTPFTYLNEYTINDKIFAKDGVQLKAHCQLPFWHRYYAMGWHIRDHWHYDYGLAYPSLLPLRLWAGTSVTIDWIQTRHQP